MSQGRRYSGLRFQFIFYALGSTFLPLIIIIILLFVFAIDLFRQELRGRVQSSIKVFRRELNAVEQRLESSTLLLSGFISSLPRFDQPLLGKLLGEQTVMGNNQILEITRKEKRIYQQFAPGSIPLISEPLYTAKERLAELWRSFNSPLVPSGQVWVNKMPRDRYLIIRGTAGIGRGRLQKRGLVILSRIVDDVFCSNIKQLSGAEITVYHQGRALISSLFSQSEIGAQNLPGYERYVQRLQQGEPLIEDRIIRHTPFAVGFVPIYQEKRVIALAAVAHDRTRFNTSVRNAMVFLMFAVLISLSILVLFGAYFSKRTLAPVFSLVDATAALAEGNLDVSVAHIPDNELGDLVESFNAMADAVREHRGLLANYNIQLQQEVEQRTKELKRAQSTIVHSIKMASLGQLTAGIAHELKNPLNFIINFSQTNIEYLDQIAVSLSQQRDRSREEVELLELLRSNQQTILRHGSKAASIIQGMLKQARGGQGEKQLYDLNLLLNESINLVYHSTRATHPELEVRFERDYEQDLPQVRVDISQLNRVFVNILDNALFALAQKKARQAGEYEPCIRVKTESGAGELRVSIEDNGIGMEADIREKIFDPFFTTKAPQQGTGLGLKICYDIIRDGHGGRIDVATRVGYFSRFTIVLPLDQEGETA